MRWGSRHLLVHVELRAGSSISDQEPSSRGEEAEAQHGRRCQSRSASTAAEGTKSSWLGPRRWRSTDDAIGVRYSVASWLGFGDVGGGSVPRPLAWPRCCPHGQIHASSPRRSPHGGIRTARRTAPLVGFALPSSTLLAAHE